MPALAERLIKELSTKSDLPPLPQVAVRLVATVSWPNTHLDEIGEIVSQDPVIAGQVIRAANSAALGGRFRIETICAALARLGLSHVRRLALVACARTAIPRPPPPFPHEIFWQHSLTVAHGTELILARMKASPREVVPDVVFLAGLLHDIGLLALACYHPKVYADIDAAAQGRQISYYQAEKQELELDHAELSAVVATQWMLPDSVVGAIRFHHAPRAAPPEHRLLARVVHLADALASRVVAEFPRGMPDDFDTTTENSLGVSGTVLFKIVTDIRAEARRAAFTWLNPG